MKYRLVWAAALIGVVAQAALVAAGQQFDLSSASGTALVAALVLTFASLLALAFVWLGENHRIAAWRPVVVVRASALSVLAVLIIGSVVLATRSDDESTPPGDENRVAQSAPPQTAPGQASQPAAEEEHVHGTGDVANPMGVAAAHEHAAEVPVTAEQLTAAGDFVADVKADTAKYADIRAGMAAGYVQITQDLPGIAAHFVNLAYLADGVEMDPARPEFLLYTKRLDGNWRLVGTMFYGKNTPEPPSYFGPLDAWHKHENLCFQASSVRVAASQADCQGGLFTKETAWQLHVWTEPDGAGVFAHDYAPIDPGAFPPADRPAAKDLVAKP